MKKITAISFNTFREAIKDKILYNLLIFSLIIIVASVFLGNLTIGENEKIIKDVGLASMSVFGMLISTLVGISLVYKEIDKKTIYTVITKPIRRSEFLLGKYLGLLLTLFINISIMTFALFTILKLQKYSFNLSLLYAIALIFLELVLITSIAIMFSTFSTPTFSAIFTLSFYIIGHLTEDLLSFGREAKGAALGLLTKICYYILPNLESFNIRAEMVRGIPVTAQYIIYTILYGIFYSALIFILSTLIFRRREFN